MHLNFLQTEVTLLLQDVPLVTQHCMHLQCAEAPTYFSQQATGFMHDTYPGCWTGRGGQLPDHQDLLTLILLIFLFGAVKSSIYEEKTNNQDAMLHRALYAAQLTGNTLDILECTINALP
jgi:hypothetical protein